ncbi:hypothetical protein ACFVJH_05575 [Streptomyces decoyicus]|uniref:hypothetical protein n=1 Tax=Streptomyces decoyicus TaxID=249567 RepID=UPI0036415673
MVAPVFTDEELEGLRRSWMRSRRGTELTVAFSDIAAAAQRDRRTGVFSSTVSW